MPGYGIPLTKYEAPSESDDDDAASYKHTQMHSRECPATMQEMCATGAETYSSNPETPSESENVTTNLLHHLQGPAILEELAPPAPSATPVAVKLEPGSAAATLATLHSAQGSSMDMRRHMVGAADVTSEFMPLMPVKDEPLSEGEQQQLSESDSLDSLEPRRSPKAWSPQDMDLALEALRTHHMSLTKASSTYGIPSTTLWQRAHRLGIDTPKKEGCSKSWGEGELRAALSALRAGAISANKASKAYGIPSSTLYKIARREGIRLAAPFNAAPTSWRRADLRRALDDVRRGGSVQRAAAAHGIPTGTLYGRCKREGIELSRSSPAPWSEGAMGEALEAVRVGQMSINQAAIHYNLPYSSLYGRFKRCKYQSQDPQNLQAAQNQIHQEHQEMEAQPSHFPNSHYQPQPPIPPPSEYGPDATPLPYPFHTDLTQVQIPEYSQEQNYSGYFHPGIVSS